MASLSCVVCTDFIGFNAIAAGGWFGAFKEFWLEIGQLMTF
jgi:hypothetical protein